MGLLYKKNDWMQLQDEKIKIRRLPGGGTVQFTVFPKHKLTVNFKGALAPQNN